MKFAVSTACAVFCVVASSAPASAQQGKPIVAIYQMDDIAQSGQAQSFSTMIETAIAATSKFRVIERERLNKLVGEQARARGGLVTTNKPGKTGGFEGADFLIYGSITTISLSKKSDVGSTLLAGLLSSGQGPSCANAFVTLGVDIKITDADTGEVKYVTRINETQKSAASCGENPTINTSGLLRTAADKVATGLVTAIYPIQIASVLGDGTVVLNYGEGAVVPGALMTVYTRGQPIIDPATGEKIGHDETKIGYFRISEVNGRISKATPAGALVSAPVVGSIVRPISAADAAAFAKPANKRR